MKRRAVIKGGAVGAALLTGLGNKTATAKHDQRNFYTIDGYSHCAPLAYLDKLEDLFDIPRDSHPSRFIVKPNPALYDPVARLGWMDDQEVDMSILIPMPFLEDTPRLVQPLNTKKAIRAAQFINDYMKDNWVDLYPERFRAAAIVPAVDAKAMVAELERAVTRNGCVGAVIATSPLHKPLDHPDYLALYAKAVELDVPLWIHPTRPPIPDYVSETSQKYFIALTIGWPYDTSVAVNRIIFSGVFDMYPDLKIVLHHQGGLIPVWWERIDGMMRWLEASGVPSPTISEPWISHAKKFYVDTCCYSHAPDILKITYDFFGPDHVLFGTDSPLDYIMGQEFIPDARSCVMDMGVNAHNRKKIFSENILDIIPSRDK